MGGLVVLSIIMGLRSRTLPRPATPITPFTVSSLRVAWTDDTGASINSPPTVVGDRVYLTNSAGKVLAYPTTCLRDSEACRPAWTADLTKASFGYGGPGVGDGMVFVVPPTDAWSAIHRPAARGRVPRPGSLDPGAI